jgi:hypothetical protein
MKRLPRNTENELLKVLRLYRTPFDEEQARLDFAGILARFPAYRALEAERKGNHKTDARILAELAADTFYHHTGRQPGRTEKKHTKAGHFPKFVATLARAGGITVNRDKLPDISREVQRDLNAKARLPRLPPVNYADDEYDPEARQAMLPERASARARLLREHIVGYEDADGNPLPEGATDLEGFDPVFGGYEAARPARPPEEVYATYLKTIKP